MLFFCLGFWRIYQCLFQHEQWTIYKLLYYDLLNIFYQLGEKTDETIFTAKQTQDDLVEMIIKDINLT